MPIGRLGIEILIQQIGSKIVPHGHLRSSFLAIGHGSLGIDHFLNGLEVAATEPKPRVLGNDAHLLIEVP